VIFLFLDDSLNSLTPSTQLMQTVLKYNNIILCTNTIAVIENFIALKKINYIYMASSQNRFVLLDSSIAVNLFKCEKALYFLHKGKKVFYSSIMKMNDS